MKNFEKNISLFKFFKIEFKNEKKKEGEDIWNKKDNFYYLNLCEVPLRDGLKWKFYVFTEILH